MVSGRRGLHAAPDRAWPRGAGPARPALRRTARPPRGLSTSCAARAARASQRESRKVRRCAMGLKRSSKRAAYSSSGPGAVAGQPRRHDRLLLSPAHSNKLPLRTRLRSACRCGAGTTRRPDGNCWVRPCRLYALAGRDLTVSVWALPQPGADSGEGSASPCNGSGSLPAIGYRANGSA